MEYKVIRFSRLQDEGYYEDARERMKEATTQRKWAAPLGGLAGAVLGASIGGPMHWKKGAAIGGVGLGAISHWAGKHNEKEVHREEKRNLANYKKASEKDREYLRHRAEKAREERLRREQINATRNAGIWASTRW